MAPRRVAVTGLGIVSPLGIGVDENWRRLCAGDSGIGLITRFDTTDFAAKIAGEVKDFDATRWLAKRELRQMDVFIQYAIACAAEAVGQAGLDKEPPVVSSGVASRYGNIPAFATQYDWLGRTGYVQFRYKFK